VEQASSSPGGWQLADNPAAAFDTMVPASLHLHAYIFSLLRKWYWVPTFRKSISVFVVSRSFFKQKWTIHNAKDRGLTPRSLTYRQNLLQKRGWVSIHTRMRTAEKGLGADGRQGICSSEHDFKFY